MNRKNCLTSALDKSLIECTVLNKPDSKDQKYRKKQL